MQQKRDTAANWTANNPTLLAGQIGFETDTNKIKIGDGSTAWTGLSYFAGSGGGGEDLSATLALGNTTNGQDIVLSSGDVIKSSATNKAQIEYLNSGQEVAITTDGRVYVTPYVYLSQSLAQIVKGSEAITVQTANIDLQHSSLLKLRAPNVELTNETASTILSTDGSKYIKSLSTATYPSLTELSYVKGLTSAVQTQLNSKVYTLIGGATNTNPADSTTYYIGGHPATTMLTSATNTVGLAVPVSGTIVAATVYAVGANGSNEATTLEIRVNDTTSANITTTGDFSAIATVGSIFSNTSMSQAVTAGQWLHLRILTPAWVTNPTGVRIWFSIAIRP